MKSNRRFGKGHADTELLEDVCVDKMSNHLYMDGAAHTQQREWCELLLLQESFLTGFSS